MPYTQARWKTHIAIDNVDYGYWAAAEGGGVTSENGSYDDWDGQIRLGGRRERDDKTLRKLYREAVHAVFKTVDAKVGAGRCVVTRTPTDDDGVSWGNPIIFTGVLAGAKLPDQDKSSSDGGELEIVINLDERLA